MKTITGRIPNHPAHKLIIKKQTIEKLFQNNKNNFRLPALVFQNINASKLPTIRAVSKHRKQYCPLFIREIYSENAANSTLVSNYMPMLRRHESHKPLPQNAIAYKSKSRTHHTASKSNTCCRNISFRDYRDSEDTMEQSNILNEWKRVISCKNI